MLLQWGVAAHHSRHLPALCANAGAEGRWEGGGEPKRRGGGDDGCAIGCSVHGRYIACKECKVPALAVCLGVAACTCDACARAAHVAQTRSPLVWGSACRAQASHTGLSTRQAAITALRHLRPAALAHSCPHPHLCACRFFRLPATVAVLLRRCYAGSTERHSLHSCALRCQSGCRSVCAASVPTQGGSGALLWVAGGVRNQWRILEGVN